MSCLSRCPYFRGVLNEGFHCTHNCPGNHPTHVHAKNITIHVRPHTHHNTPTLITPTSRHTHTHHTHITTHPHSSTHITTHPHSSHTHHNKHCRKNTGGGCARVCECTECAWANCVCVCVCVVMCVCGDVCVCGHIMCLCVCVCVCVCVW